MSVSIVYARYGPQQITDPGTLESLTASISNFADVIVNPQNLTNVVYPAPGIVNTAVVAYHNREGDALRFRAATDFNPLTFSKGILWIFYGPANNPNESKTIVDQSVYDHVYASFLSKGTFTVTAASMGGDPYPGQEKLARIGFSFAPGGTSYSNQAFDNGVFDWQKIYALHGVTN